MLYVLELLGSAFQPNITRETILRHLTFTQSLAPSLSRDLNPVLWTLTHEALYYTVVPLLFLVRSRVWLLVVLAAAFLLLHYCGRAASFTALVLLVSAISYFAIELPSMTWLRNWLVGLLVPPRKATTT